MSKQSEAKEAQGYEPKPTSATCGNCAHFKVGLALPEWAVRANIQRPNRYGPEYAREKYLRCSIGGFAVKKMATCSKFAAQKPA